MLAEVNDPSEGEETEVESEQEMEDVNVKFLAFDVAKAKAFMKDDRSGLTKNERAVIAERNPGYYQES